MADVDVVIRIPEEVLDYFAKHNCMSDDGWFSYSTQLLNAFRKGTSLPKGYGDLFTKTEILRFLKCPKYENCSWKNCFDCNKSHCINLNNVNDLVPVIKADEESEDQ